MRRELIIAIFTSIFDLDPNYKYKQSKDGSHIFWVAGDFVKKIPPVDTKILSKLNNDLRLLLNDKTLDEYYITSISIKYDDPNHLLFVLINASESNDIVVKKIKYNTIKQ